MKRTDVVYGSKVGNITNPEFLEVDSWVHFKYIYKLLNKSFAILDYKMSAPCIRQLKTLMLSKLALLFKWAYINYFFLKNKHISTISITVVDLQTSSLPLIYQTQFSDFNLNVGYNILSQNWMEKKLTANFNRNTFRYLCLSFTYILNFGDFFSLFCFFLLNLSYGYKFYRISSNWKKNRKNIHHIRWIRI